MSTQLEKLQAVIYKARWVDGGIATDKAIAEAVLESLKPPVLDLPHSNEYQGYVNWTPAVGSEVKTRSGGFPSIPRVKQADGTWKPKY